MKNKREITLSNNNLTEPYNQMILTEPNMINMLTEICETLSKQNNCVGCPVFDLNGTKPIGNPCSCLGLGHQMLYFLVSVN